MPPNNRWRVQGVDRKTRRLARQAAARSGVSVGEWIDKAILTHGGVAPRGPTAPLVPAEFMRSARISESAEALADPSHIDPSSDATSAPESEPAIDTASAPDPVTEPLVEQEANEEPTGDTLPEPEPDPGAESGGEDGDATEAEAEAEGEPESEPELNSLSAQPLSIDPDDRPVPTAPIDLVIAAATTGTPRRLDPRVMGGVLAAVLLIGGFWLWSERTTDLPGAPTGRTEIAEAEPPRPAVPESTTKRSLTDDLENNASLIPQTPFERMTAAAQTGDPKAQHDLAIMYLRGNGVPIDHAQAAIWLEKSASSGIPKAQYNLGLLYEKGLGVTQNYGTAFSWYRRAAQQGHTRAQHNLGTLFAVGKGTKQNYAEAARWFTRASKEGLAEAHYSLGLLHEKGLGVESDPRRAAAFYRSALAAGSAQAAEKLTRLEPALKELAPRREGPVTASTTDTQRNARTEVTKSRTLTPAGIINLQRLLAKLDLAPGPADGVIGKKTVDAIKLYQRFAGLPVDGKPTPDLLKDLRQVVGAMAPNKTN